MEHPLDNPVWHALVGPHAKVALGSGLARHYPRDIAPFSAVAGPSPAAYEDLALDLPEGLETRLFRPAEEPVPEGWTGISARPILQMVFDRPGSADHHERASRDIKQLTPTDATAACELAEVAKPGPFGRRTMELGTYVGVLRNHRLVAIAGERFRLADYVELSGIAVHPEARGQGFASALIMKLCKCAEEHDVIPFLHVFPENPAVALYEHLGFRTRTQLWVLWRRPAAR